MDKKLYITFYTNSDAIAAERLCKNKGIEAKLVSVPRSLSAGCGMALESSPEYRATIILLFTDNDIDIEETAEF